MDTSQSQPKTGWTWLAALVAVFMVATDTLVVTTALPVIRVDLNTDLEGLEWTVNAYTLTFAVFLLTWAAFGDRFGRRRIFMAGLATFTLASIAAALAPDIGTLIAARAVQGLGAAAILPLSLTLLASVVAPEQRGHAFGLWGAMVGLGIAVGPVIGGSITEAWSWQWIFWVNVPVGVFLLLLMGLVRESLGGAGRLDPTGTVLVTAGSFGIVFGLVRGNGLGWDSTEVISALIAGGVLLILFVLWEARAKTPMVPLGLFRSRGFSLTMAIAMIMPFGVFGTVFLVTQYLQTALGYSPLDAGVRTLAWTAMPMIAAPISGRLTDKVGGKPLLVLGLVLQVAGIAWIGMIAEPDLPYGDLVAPFVLTGLGLGLFLPPIAHMAIGFVSTDMEGVASGASNAVRQLGTVLGVSVLGAIFGSAGGYASPQAFVDGMVPANFTAAGALAFALLLALALPKVRVHSAEPQASTVAPESAPAPTS